MDQVDKLSDEIYTADLKHIIPSLERGPAGAKQFARQVLRDSPDMHMALEDMFGEDDRLAVRLTCTSIDATTGKRVTFQVMTISRYAGNKCAEYWELVGSLTEVPA